MKALCFLKLGIPAAESSPAGRRGFSFSAIDTLHILKSVICEKFHKLRKLLLAKHLPSVEFPSRRALMKSEIQTYRECVEQLLLSRSSNPVSNGKPEHAAVLFELFFRHAQKFVKIFWQKLDERVFDQPQVIEAAADALKRGVAIDIIVQGEPDAKKFMHRMRPLDQESEKMEIIEDANSKISAARRMKANFAVMDGRAYRIEPDASELKASACMNNPGIAAELVRAFNSLRSQVA